MIRGLIRDLRKLKVLAHDICILCLSLLLNSRVHRSCALYPLLRRDYGCVELPDFVRTIGYASDPWLTFEVLWVRLLLLEVLLD